MEGGKFYPWRETLNYNPSPPPQFGCVLGRWTDGFGILTFGDFWDMPLAEKSVCVFFVVFVVFVSKLSGCGTGRKLG